MVRGCLWSVRHPASSLSQKSGLTPPFALADLARIFYLQISTNQRSAGRKSANQRSAGGNASAAGCPVRCPRREAVRGRDPNLQCGVDLRRAIVRRFPLSSEKFLARRTHSKSPTQLKAKRCVACMMSGVVGVVLHAAVRLCRAPRSQCVKRWEGARPHTQRQATAWLPWHGAAQCPQCPK